MATDLAVAIANAIQRQEGICSGDVCRNNNPGALMNPSTGTLASYPDYQSGYNALVNQVQLNINRGLTLDQFFGGGPGYPGYAPAAAGNDPVAYASNVGSWVGIDTNTPLNQISYSGGGAAASSAGSGLVVDLSGAAASTPTADILSSVGGGDGADPLGISAALASAGIDLTDPTTLLIGAVLVGGIVWAVAG